MQSSKAKLEVGPLKFDFEGDREDVDNKIEKIQPLIKAWLDKMVSQDVTVPSHLQNNIPKVQNVEPIPEQGNVSVEVDPSLEKIFKKGKVVSLHTRPEPTKAFLLVLLGYRTLLNQEVVGSAQLAKSFDETGITYTRLSRVADPLAAGGFINIAGQK